MQNVVIMEMSAFRIVSQFVILCAPSNLFNLNFITDTEFRILDLKRKKEPVRKKPRKKPDVIPPR
jgi:hypothetical protein